MNYLAEQHAEWHTVHGWDTVCPLVGGSWYSHSSPTTVPGRWTDTARRMAEAVREKGRLL